MAQGCIPDADPPHAQVTGAEGSSELEGTTGSRLPRTQPGEMWAPGTPSTVPTDGLQNANTKKMIKKCKMTPGVDPSECALCNSSGSLPKAKAAGKQGLQGRYVSPSGLQFLH